MLNEELQKIIAYNTVVRNLMENDPKAEYNQLNDYCNGNYTEANNLLKTILIRIINEFSVNDIEGEEFNFYVEQYRTLK